ncbi:MAG TPA: putative toxin-antitoxin system toxin component, PIN family [Thermomicrobiales bacterium]|nr:putative toxin-antitoxin system toxin component, PIN family [Thermomicrobiales bacterium]
MLDVNILASASVSPDRTPWRVVQAAFRADVLLFVSTPMLQTLDIVLGRPYFAARLTSEERESFLASIRGAAKRKRPDKTVSGIAPDAEDDLVLGTAVAANAEYLVTGDKGLLAIGSYRGVRIVTAEDFLRVVEQT